MPGAFFALFLRQPNTRCKNALQNAIFLECLRAGHAVFNSTTHDFFASRARIPVANVPDYCIEEVSNHAILLLLACAKRLNILERTVKEGKWDYSVTKPVHAIRGRTLGLLGAGNIACCVAKKAQAFGMKVIASDPGLRQE